jgi:integrase/recombinase XerD
VKRPRAAIASTRRGEDFLDRELPTYLDHLAVERGLSSNTLSAYRADLTRYVAFLTKRGVITAAGVRDADIRAFVASISASTHGPDDAPYAPTSVARALSSVRSFHRFLLREGVIEHDPAAGVVRPKLPRALPHPLTVDEVQGILEAPDAGTTAGLRDRAILELLYGAGLRVSELTGLDVDDVDLDEGSVRVLGKGGKEREVPLGRFAREATEAYLTRARPALAAPRTRSACFLNARGGSSTATRVPPGSVVASRRTTCDTRSRRICSTAAPTSGWFRSCSDTRASPRPRSTRW